MSVFLTMNTGHKGCAINKEGKKEMKQTGRGRLWYMVRNIGLFIAVTLFLHGCGVTYPVGPPSQREPVQAPEEGKAAGALLASARQNVMEGQFSKAEMILERALRVEPRNARLWHEMAQVKYGQKDYGQAVQFCIKSNSLAGKDNGLIQQNWLLMEKAYVELGEPEKAEEARIKSR
jgi:tetratricopeptide (TPR) repeat protein